jgi:hypothetical protein
VLGLSVLIHLFFKGLAMTITQEAQLKGKKRFEAALEVWQRHPEKHTKAAALLFGVPVALAMLGGAVWGMTGYMALGLISTASSMIGGLIALPSVAGKLEPGYDQPGTPVAPEERPIPVTQQEFRKEARAIIDRNPDAFQEQERARFLAFKAYGITGFIGLALLGVPALPAVGGAAVLGLVGAALKTIAQSVHLIERAQKVDPAFDTLVKARAPKRENPQAAANGPKDNLG